MELNSKNLQFDTHEHMARKNNLGSGHRHYGTCGGTQQLGSHHEHFSNIYDAHGNNLGCGKENHNAHGNKLGCGKENHSTQRKYSDCHCGGNHSQRNQMNNCNNHSYGNGVEPYDIHPDTYSSCHEN